MNAQVADGKYAPDFFLIGAPKAGTTSLHHYLAEHPRLCAASEKEPYYFCSDLGDMSKVVDEKMYTALFRACSPGQLSYESSVWYLYSQEAVPEILSRRSDARFIVLLRNPVDIAISLHGQLLRTLQEDQEEFAAAWALQQVRADGKALPHYCPAPALLQYRRACSLGEQSERLLRHVKADQVLFLDYRHLIDRPQDLYSSVMTFLSVDHDGRDEFPVHNESRVWRSQFLASLMRNPNPTVSKAMMGVKGALNRRGIRPMTWIRPLVTRPGKRPPVTNEVKVQVEKEFAEDIRLLKSVTGIDVGRYLAQVS
jgi:hypothetical protein